MSHRPNRDTRRLIWAHKRGDALPPIDAPELSIPAAESTELPFDSGWIDFMRATPATGEVIVRDEQQAADAALTLRDGTRIDLGDPWAFAPSAEVRA